MYDNENDSEAETNNERKKYPGQVLAPSQKFWALRIIHQEWLKKLTPSEYMVLMFIWNRTIYWGKIREFIKYRHFTKGIPDTISGLPFKERRLKDILDSLQKKGAILRTQRVYGSWYEIKFGWQGKNVKRKNTRKRRAANTDKTTPQKTARRTQKTAG